MRTTKTPQRVRVRLLAIAWAVLVLGFAAPAHGEDEDAPEAALRDDVAPLAVLPPVVVTARRWTENPRDVPQSLTAVPGRLVRDAGLRSIRDAALFVPNLNLVEFSARRLSFPFVRGIGSGQGDPAVATYVDGVPQLSVSSTNLPLLNVERIEFLRGPQGTLYGRNALGGVIHVVTRKPAPVAEVRAESTLGSHHLHEVRLLGSTPIVAGRLSLGLAGLFLRRDGYTKNDVTGHDVDERDTLFGQAQLLWTPDRRNEVRFALHGERTRDGGFALSDLAGLRARPHRIRQDFEGETHRDIVAPAVTWNHRGRRVDVTSISAFTHSQVLETTDFDFSVLDGVRRRTEESLDAFTQELRIASPPGASTSLGRCARIRWLAGALYFTSASARTTANEFGPGGVGIVAPVAGTDTARGDFDDHGFSLFAQATLTLFDELDVGAGLRYDYESKRAVLRRDFVSGGVTLASSSQRVSETYDQVLPRFDVAWRCHDRFTVYGFAAKGFKAGGFNLDAPPGRIAFRPETSWTFEGGVKTSLFDDRLRINAAGFFIDWDDMQLSQFNAAVGGYVTNAGASTSRGLELELAARPVGNLDLFAAFGCTDTEFESYVDPYGVDVSGNDLPFAPATTFSTGAQLHGRLGRGLRYHLRGEYVGVGTFYYDAGNREAEQFGLANFRAGVVGPRWRLEAWVRNAFDEAYVPVAFQPNPMDASVFVGESGAPRTFGVTFSMDL